MFIGIDGNEANHHHRVGSNIYSYRLLESLHNLDQGTFYRVYLKSLPQSDLPPTSNHWQYRVFGPAKLWTQCRLPLDLFLTHPRPKLFFSPGHYAPRFSPIPTVITILDLAFLHFPATFKPMVLRQLKAWTTYSVKKAHHIFTISESTKRDIINTYHTNPDSITVTYPGPNLHNIKASPFEPLQQRFNLDTPYFIFLGTRQPRKNLARALKAFTTFRLHSPNTKFVVVGKTWHQFTSTLATPNDHVVYTDYLPDNQVVSLLTHSLALVFPRLYEGFGIPVVEAMQLGVPVLASNTSSLPEITGNSPLTFNPYSVKAISKAMLTLSTMSETSRQTLIKSAKIKATNFTWERCAQQTMKVLHELTL